MNNLAKLHGVSHVLIQENGGKSTFLQNNPHLTDCLLKGNSDQRGPSPIVEAIFEVLEKSEVAGSSELLVKLEKYKTKWFSSIADVLRPDSLFPVVNHGDVWSNNTMFSYGKDGILDKVMFYDMQLCRVASPAADLSYYMYTSVQPCARKQWKTLLESYFTELGNTLTKFGHQLTFTFNDFLQEYRKVVKMGFLIGATMDFGLDAMKSYDTDSESRYLFDIPGGLKKLVTEFVSKKPDKVREIVLNLVSLAKDFEEAGTL